MDHTTSTNGYLTREQSDKKCYSSIDITGLGLMHFRKLGRPEWESFWPLLPPAADDWPTIIPIEGEGDARAASIEANKTSAAARRLAEFNWLRAQPDDEQVRYQARRNDIAFRTIAACCLVPTYTVAQARALGDWADVLYLAIMTFSGLYKEPEPAPTPAEVEVPAVVAQ
jgi:hypothetical protein